MVITAEASDYRINNCTMKFMFDYEKFEPFSGLPPYEAAALVDITEPNHWRMCRLGRCYMLRDDHYLPIPSTWEEAEEFCQSHNGHLLSINSDTEQTVVLDWLSRRPFWGDEYYNKRSHYRHGYKTVYHLTEVETALERHMTSYLRASAIFIGLKAHQVCLVLLATYHIQLMAPL
jgi:hypothetical protein